MVGESEEEEDEDQEYNEDEGEDSKVYGKLRDDFDNPIKVVFKKPRGSYSKFSGRTGSHDGHQDSRRRC